MSRRSNRGEIEFGSDSFLDVVANIVGILIILIVVAGVRVSQMPAVTSSEREPTQPPASFDPEGLFPPLASLPAPEAAAAQPEPSPALIEEQRKLEAEIAALASEAESHAGQIERLTPEQKTLSSGLGDQARLLAAELEALEQGALEVQQLRGLIDETRSRLIDVEAHEDRLEKLPANVTQIKHRLTPVSHEVRGKEMHFQVIGNKVTHVPVDELVERLREQIQRQKDWLVKFPRHQGEVGPVRGFTMAYIVQRQAAPVLAQLQQGRGMIKISVSEWVIQPSPEIAAEALPEAMQLDSEFVRALRAADAGATLTFWVYPDSYRMFRELQEFAHREGFTVAARPMPFGVPIAGSPDGTRSAGQ